LVGSFKVEPIASRIPSRGLADTICLGVVLAVASHMWQHANCRTGYWMLAHPAHEQGTEAPTVRMVISGSTRALRL